MNDDDCPDGEDCCVHFRVDDSLLCEEDEYARLVTYSGDYAVITRDHYSGGVKPFLARALGLTPSPRWETLILRVGSGTIADVAALGYEASANALVYGKTHDEWEYIQGVHEVTVSALQAGMIELEPK